MKRPVYQDYGPEKLPKVLVSYPGREPTTWCNIIAGSVCDVESVITTESPIALVHFILAPGAKMVWTVPPAYEHDGNVGIYVSSGTGTFGGPVKEEEEDKDGNGTGVIGSKGDFILFQRKVNTIGSNCSSGVVFSNNNINSTEPLMLMLMAGKALDEPVARYGPFVMNTEDEIQQCFSDFRSGKMGEIAALVKK